MRPERPRDASGDVPRASGDLRNRSLHGESSPECRKAKKLPELLEIPSETRVPQQKP